MRILRLLLLAVLVGVTGLVLARFVVRGPVDERSLAQAVVRETGSADRLLGATQPCRRTGRTGISVASPPTAAVARTIACGSGRAARASTDGGSGTTPKRGCRGA